MPNDIFMKKVRVECRHIHFSHGPAKALNDVSLDIAPGEFFALLGPSGSGKSTLMRVIAGLEAPDLGRVLLDGRDVSEEPAWARQVAMVFQNHALWPHMSVAENIAFGLIERRVEPPIVRIAVSRWLSAIGLQGQGDREPNQLSGGQQQRVAWARALAAEPRLLLLDEPFSNVDKTLRLGLRQQLRTLQQHLGITTVLVTHDQEEALGSADRIAVLDNGAVQQVGSPTSLYDYPANTTVARAVGQWNLFIGSVRSRQGGVLLLDVEGVGELRVPLRSDTPATSRLSIGFRPHAVKVGHQDDVHDARYTWLAGTVENVEFLGRAIRYRVRIGDHAVLVDEPHHRGASRQAVGTDITLGIELARCRQFAA
ncbi:ABC-type spermidine/putrescine transport system, ATPase component [Variovorax sp. CF313]|nr:ABC-type spermidine/putrescine transport system, ATPase component [Variovorax sp. CF313]